jgi:CheY-like chemotaxis protein
MPDTGGVHEPELVCYPPDEAFEGRVRAAVDAEGWSAPGATEAVTLKLHASYPELRIVVHESHDPTGSGTGATWIVFRDGPERQHHDRHNGQHPVPVEHEPVRYDIRGRPCSEPPVVLVVDDEPLVLMLVAAVLTLRGWRILRAVDGADALAKAEGVNLDLLITDHDMPGIDGATLARRLCESDPGLPVLVVSGHPEEVHWVDGIRYDFLAKPFSIEDLANRVESLTGYATAWVHQGSSSG